MVSFTGYLVILSISLVIGLLSMISPITILMFKQQKTLEILSFQPSHITGVTGLDSVSGDIYLSKLNKKLDDGLKILRLGEHHGPETIDFNSKGQLYFALMTGEIRYLDPPFDIISLNEFIQSMNSSQQQQQPIIDKSKSTGIFVGRALGLKFDKNDNLYISDALQGLLRFNHATKELVILASHFNGSRLNFVNDLDIAKDGVIYFTDSTSLAPVFDKFNHWNTLHPSMYTIFASVPHGRLFSYNPQSNELKLLLEGIRYANGVAIDPKEESIFVAETSTYRVLRFWLKGVNKGKSEIFIDNLPGYPDGVDIENDILYISIYGGRSKLLDFLHPIPILKSILLHIPFIKVPVHPPTLIAVNYSNGRILDYYQGNKTPMKSITSCVENNKKIYLGNLLNNFIGVFDNN